MTYVTPHGPVPLRCTTTSSLVQAKWFVFGCMIMRDGDQRGALEAALTELSDAELHALIAAVNAVPPIAYGLLVWIEGACD